MNNQWHVLYNIYLLYSIFIDMTEFPRLGCVASLTSLDISHHLEAPGHRFPEIHEITHEALLSVFGESYPES